MNKPLAFSLPMTGVASLFLALSSWSPIADAAPRAGKAYGDWQVQCPGAEAGAKTQPRCNLFQNVSLQNSKQTVMQIAVGYLPKVENPLMLITLPLGIWLPPGAILDIDGKQLRKMEFDRCGQDSGCLIGFQVESGLQAKLRAGTVMHVTYRDAGHRPITLPVSLAGLSNGLDALRGAAPKSKPKADTSLTAPPAPAGE